jgi:hypothetical protein
MQDLLKVARVFTLMILILAVQASLYIIFYTNKKSKIRNHGYKQMSTIAHALWILYAVFDSLYFTYRARGIEEVLNIALLSIDSLLQISSMLLFILVNIKMTTNFISANNEITLFYLKFSQIFYVSASILVWCMSVGEGILTVYFNSWASLNKHLFRIAKVAFYVIASIYLFVQNIKMTFAIRKKADFQKTILTKWGVLVLITDIVGIVGYVLLSLYTKLYSIEYYCAADICNSVIGIHCTLMCLQYEAAMKVVVVKRRVSFLERSGVLKKP